MKLRLFAAALVAAALLPALAWAQGSPKKVATVEGITEYQLDNGCKVLLFPDNSRPRVTVNMTVLVGSRHEGYGETGMAHLLEHMVFKGTPTHPHIPRALQERGASYNGTTNVDRTNYFETLPASDANLEFAVRLEADRLVNSYIKREDLASEFTVVRNEFESGENSPGRVLNQRMMAAAYEWHNYGKSTIGNRSDIERVPIENLQAFYRKYYQPDNVVVIIAGQFEEAKALEYVQKYFGSIPRPSRKLDKTWTEEPAQDGERLVTLRRVGEVGLVGVMYHIPAGSHEEFPPFQVLSSILTTEPSGRLYKSLVETKKATSVFASAMGLHDPGVFDVTATVRKGQKLEEVRDQLIAEIEDVANQGVTNEEVQRAKRQYTRQREMAMQDPSQFAIALSNWAAQGDWRLYFVNRDRLEAVTPEAVQAVAAKYLKRSNRTVGLFIPTDKPDRVAVAPTPDVKAVVEGYKGRETVAAGEAFDTSPANIEARVQRSELPEGIKVALLPKKTRGEAVTAVVTLHYGNEENLKGYESAAGFLGGLMMRGTQKMSYQQLRDELDRLKASISPGFGGFGGRGGRRGGGGGEGNLGTVTFTVQARRDTLPAVLGLLQQILREPLLPADEFETMKRERLAGLEQQKTEPQALASRLVQRKLSPYPPGDVRYVPTIFEETQRLQATTYEQVKRLYTDYLGAQSGEVVIVGDFDPAACTPILSGTFAGWKARMAYARITHKVKDDVAGSKDVIVTPDKANANFVAGITFALSDQDPDYPALVIGNYILGGGSLSSRLGDRVRQREGLSYGVGSSFSASPVEKRASINFTAICNPDNIGKVEKAIGEEIERILTQGVTADEVAKAKQGYLQQQRMMRTADFALAALLAGAMHNNRPLSYYAELEKKVEALTPDQVNAALKKYLDPKKLVVVTAGDFKNAK
jgi:zinc protease